MKIKLLILFFITICMSLSGTTYYISPGGSDTNGNGTSGNPWKSLSYACAHTTKYGDIIHVNEGTYIETNECILAAGVSIEGMGATSIIKSHYLTTRTGAGINHASISLISSSEGTDGSQSISNIKLDGDDLTGSIGIVVKRRSNVKIHDITIVDFYINGVTFSGATDYGRPSIYATGNELYNTTITNCGQEEGSWDGGGLIQVGGQDGMLIHDNILNETGRSQGHNGNIVNGAYYNKGVKYYRNKSYKPDYDGESWNFHIESWNVEGGFEIYDNEFYGGDTAIDCGGIFNKKGNYDYSIYIHDNLFTGTPVESYNGKYSICIEGNSSNDIWIFRNHFLNLPHPIQQCDGISGACEARRIYICNNILENCGWTVGGSYMNILEFVSDKSVDVLSDIFIYNNVIMGSDNTHTAAIKMDINGTVSNFNIVNNIIFNNSNGSFLSISNSNSFDGLNVNNNVLYHNGNNNPGFSGNPVTNYKYSNNLYVDPQFVSATDFHLKSTSPCIDQGLDVGLPYQGNAPDIGAFEVPSDTPAPVPVFVSAAVDNSTPSVLVMTYDLILNSSIIPAISSFGVFVNGTSRKINSVTIPGTRVQLALESPVKYGDIIMLSYSKPSNNQLQTSSGGIAETIIFKPVMNNCQEPSKPNNPPLIVINSIIDGYSGFVYEIDASGSYDLENDPLIYKWTSPENIPVSSTSNSKIRFLAPELNTSQILDFQLTINDGVNNVSKTVPINILPYKPELEMARISGTQGSSYQAPDIPGNSSDGTLTTQWSANGDNQWLLFTLAQPFKISYLEIAFLSDQNFSSCFDIYASQDNLTWKPIIVHGTSCDFSGDFQVFDFPAISSNIECSYLKFIGHGNSINNLNTVSEFRIFGTPSSDPGAGNSLKPKIVLYPNPANNLINISIDEATLPPDKILIFDHVGKIVLESVLYSANRRVQIPLVLETGQYTVELFIGNKVLFDQKIIVIDK